MYYEKVAFANDTSTAGYANQNNPCNLAPAARTSDTYHAIAQVHSVLVGVTTYS